MCILYSAVPSHIRKNGRRRTAGWEGLGEERGGGERGIDSIDIHHKAFVSILSKENDVLWKWLLVAVYLIGDLLQYWPLYSLWVLCRGERNER